jgi:hypothetical protein
LAEVIQESMNMKDSERRRIILQDLYDARAHPRVVLEPDGKAPYDTTDEIRRIVMGLAEKRLVNFTGQVAGQIQADITAAGVDLVDADFAHPPVAFAPVTNFNTTIHSGSGIQVGTQNEMVIRNVVEAFVQAIDQSSATSEQKKEAKGVLSQFLEHPAITSIVGGLARAAGSAFLK